MGKTGTVTGRTPQGAVSVKFTTLSHRFNPSVLITVHVHREGDTVRVLCDLDLVKLLNKRVGCGRGIVEVRVWGSGSYVCLSLTLCCRV